MGKHRLQSFLTSIPARMDRLPWSWFHWTVVLALGITWILDGLEVTLVGAISGILESPQTLGLNSQQIGLAASSYVSGSVLGSLVFGYLTDRWGRQRLLYITLSVYLFGAIATAFSWNLLTFCLFRFCTGAGIGGEYSAINSAVDELIPARLRGRVDLMINGSYWLGAAAGALSTLVILNPRYFAIDLGWRVGFASGGILGLVILLLRKYVPESPRWLVVHGRKAEAEKIVADIEQQIEDEREESLPPTHKTLRIQPQDEIHLKQIFTALFQKYRRHSFVCFVLIVAQAFMYNSVFFTYALVLKTFYKVPAQSTGLYLLPFALGNLLGPFVLGHFFDTVGRRKMIAGTYTMAALLLGFTAYLFLTGHLTAFSQTCLWTIIFFFGSVAASSSYLTVSEIFPLETRGLVIALFYSLGTAVGGIAAPWLFGLLIDMNERQPLFYGYVGVAVLMLIAGIVEFIFGFDAENKSLEQIAAPLTSSP